MQMRVLLSAFTCSMWTAIVCGIYGGFCDTSGVPPTSLYGHCTTGHHAFDCGAVLGAVNASALLGAPHASALRADRACPVRGFGH